MDKQSTKSEHRRNAKAERLMHALGTANPLTVALRGKIRKFIETLVTTERTEVRAAVRHTSGPSRQGIAMGGFSRR